MCAATVFAKIPDGVGYRQHSQNQEEEADHLIPKDMDGPNNSRQDMER